MWPEYSASPFLKPKRDLQSNFKIRSYLLYLKVKGVKCVPNKFCRCQISNGFCDKQKSVEQHGTFERWLLKFDHFYIFIFIRSKDTQSNGEINTINF